MTNDTEANAAGRSVRACVARKSPNLGALALESLSLPYLASHKEVPRIQTVLSCFAI
jgi:hypothetical protein